MFKHVHQALIDIEELRRRVLENRMFKGYSGRARLLSAAAVLLGTLVMALPFYPQTTLAHAIGWGSVCGLALAFNYVALFCWYQKHPADERELGMLRPAIDPLPALTVGAILTLVCLEQGQERFLFGVWMMMYGLVHTSSRYALPSRIWWLGWYYLVCGTWYFLVLRAPSFVNPWTMGAVFVIGECMGSVILKDHRRSIPNKGKTSEEVTQNE